jgi:hypothetical protein
MQHPELISVRVDLKLLRKVDKSTQLKKTSTLERHFPNSNNPHQGISANFFVFLKKPIGNETGIAEQRTYTTMKQAKQRRLGHSV